LDPRHLFMDNRLTGMCVYCGAQPTTRDHIPPKVFLDAPYPPLLSVVDACLGCNQMYSLDEEYLACLLECVICGSSEPDEVTRLNIRRILGDSPALRIRIDAARCQDMTGCLLWEPETARIENLAVKLARGHAAYELYPILDEPVDVLVTPLDTMLDQEICAFEETTQWRSNLYPEIGSRSFLRTVGPRPDRFKKVDDWIIVQPGRYRYSVIESRRVSVRIVLSEYLACVVVWNL